jgi:hypothetical protein
MSTLAEVKAAIDAAITNQTEDDSVSQTTVGTQMKNVAQFASDSSALKSQTLTENLDIDFTQGTDYSLLEQTKDGFHLLARETQTGNEAFLAVGSDGTYIEYQDGGQDGGNVTIQADQTGAWVRDTINNLGGFYLGEIDFAKGRANRMWWAAWGAVEDYVDEGFDPGIATLVNGQVTVSSALVKTISRQITLGYASVNGTLGMLVALTADITDNTSFIIKSLLTDGSINTADNSDVRYCVIGD